jgi:hypothetical protein
MSSFDVNEVHTAWVPAKPEDAYRAVREVTVGEVPLLRGLMALRAVPGAVTGKPFILDPSRPFLDQAFELGFVELGERVPSELAVGAVGRFWLPAGNRPLDRIRSREDFMRFDEPGFAKAAMDFLVRPEGDGSSITTETRVIGTDPGATWRFRLYWLLIRPWSGLIRRSVLRSLRERLSGAPSTKSA